MEPVKKSTKETSSLSQSRKGPKTCYGATRNPESTADYKLVKHDLALSDTLQGLAIKYGITVEQIRRVNRLWTNDNILIFKTINIPVKLAFDSNEENLMNDDDPKTSRNTRRDKSNTLECDSEESVDSVEVNIDDINVDIEHSRTKSDSSFRRVASSNTTSTLDSYLKKLDGEMKASIQNAKKQRANSGPLLEASYEEDRSKGHKQMDSNHVRLKNKNARRHKVSQSLDDENGSLDDLFEL